MPCMTHVIWFYYGKSNIHGPKKDRYHDAVNHTCDNTSLVKCLQTFAQKKVQYHNAVNDTRYLIYSGNIPHKLSKKLGTMMPCMTHVISSFYGKSHINSPKKLGTMMVYDTCYFILLCKIIEGSLEVKLPTIWTDEKQSREEAERRERLEERRVEEKESEERRCRCAKR